jgi:ABC-type sulfate transport system permease component
MENKLTTTLTTKVVIITYLFFLSFTGYAQTQLTPQKTWVIKNVNVIPMTVPNTIIYNATVTIMGNRIKSINDTFPKNFRSMCKWKLDRKK